MDFAPTWSTSHRRPPGPDGLTCAFGRVKPVGRKGSDEETMRGALVHGRFDADPVRNLMFTYQPARE